MATDDMTLWSLATLTRLGALATGRLRLGVTVPNGDQVLAEIGSTGERDITSMLQNVKSGKLVTARFGPFVTYNLEELELTNPAVTSLRSGSGLEMMTPTMGLKACALTSAGGEDLARFGVSAGGALALWGAAGTNKYSGSLTFATDKAWGSALPGVKNGDTAVAGV